MAALGSRPVPAPRRRRDELSRQRFAEFNTERLKEELSQRSTDGRGGLRLDRDSNFHPVTEGSSNEIR
jgi:hypothetical protein